MVTLNSDTTEDPPVPSVHAFTDELIKNCYPQLFIKLNLVGYLLEDLKFSLKKNLLLSIHQKMNEEMIEIYRKEKQVLFPLLLQLEEEHKTSDSCKPFKKVKYHYTYLVSTIQQLKTQINEAMRDQEELKELHALKDHVQEFEEELIKIQNNKEQNLFKKFRNCSHGCKSL